jgi:pilus biogenesis lipoprotein CpaD
MTTAGSGLSKSSASAWRGALAIGVLALFLAGCGATTPPGVELGDYTVAPRDVLQVESIADSHVVRFGRAGSVGKPERDRLDAFVADIAENHPESLHVALRGAATPAQFRAVADRLVADGVDPRNVARAGWRSGPPVPRGAVAVAAERAVAVLPDCPGWIDHLSAPTDNRTNPNLGCSDLTNFAATVADPHHLSKGASSIYFDGERAATSVASYRADKVKELPPMNEGFSVGK